MKMMPSAEALTRIPSWEWLRCHVDGARSRPIVRAARVADSLQRTVDQPAADVEKALQIPARHRGVDGRRGPSARPRRCRRGQLRRLSHRHPRRLGDDG